MSERCPICGVGLPEYECPLCGRVVCADCWDFDEDLCIECSASLEVAMASQDDS